MALWQRGALSLIPDEEGWSVAAESKPGTSKLLRWNFAFPPPFPPLKQRFIFHSWGTRPLQQVAWEQRLCFKHRGAGAGARTRAACTGKWSHGSYWHLNNTLEEGEGKSLCFLCQLLLSGSRACSLSLAAKSLGGMKDAQGIPDWGWNGRHPGPSGQAPRESPWSLLLSEPLFLFSQAEGSKKGSALEPLPHLIKPASVNQH